MARIHDRTPAPMGETTTARGAYLAALGLTDWVRRDAPAPGDECLTHAGTSAVVAEAVQERVAIPAEPAPDVGPVSAPEPSVEAPPRAPDPLDAESNAASASVVTADARATIRLGPGKGSCLFLVGPGDDEASPLASDLARVPGDAPVWAHVASSDEGQTLELAIAERLFTQVVVFGDAAARLVFGGEAPATCGPARVTVVDALSRLGSDAGARRSCWAAFKAAGVASPP